MRRARACLDATVERDPGYAEAWAVLTRVLSVQRWYGSGLDPPVIGDGAKRAYLVPWIVEAGNRAEQLAPDVEVL